MYVLRQYYYEIVHCGDGKNIQGILYRVLYREGCTISTPCTIPSSVYYTLYYHKVHTVLPYSTPCTIQNPVLYRDLYSTAPARVTLAGL